MKKSLLYLFIVMLGFCVNAENIIKLPDVLQPISMRVKNGDLFLVDQHSIKIFSLDTGKPLATFGRKGEGPREFKDYPDIVSIANNQLVVTSPGKISTFSISGKLLKERRTRKIFLGGGHFKPVGSNYIGYKIDAGKKDDFYLVYVLLDSNFKEMKELDRGSWIIHKNRKKDLLEVFFYDVYKDRFVFAHYRQQGILSILNSQGDQLRKIKAGLEPLPFEDVHKQQVINFWQTQPGIKERIEYEKKRTIFPDNFPVIRTCRVDKGEGLVYVVSYRKVKGGSESIVYNMDGEFIKKKVLPLEVDSFMEYLVFTIHKGRLYQMFENEDNEIYELHIHDLN